MRNLTYICGLGVVLCVGSAGRLAANEPAPSDLVAQYLGGGSAADSRSAFRTGCRFTSTRRSIGSQSLLTTNWSRG
jgi:hypothetical protein